MIDSYTKEVKRELVNLQLFKAVTTEKLACYIGLKKGGEDVREVDADEYRVGDGTGSVRVYYSDTAPKRALFCEYNEGDVKDGERTYGTIIQAIKSFGGSEEESKKEYKQICDDFGIDTADPQKRKAYKKAIAQGREILESRGIPLEFAKTQQVGVVPSSDDTLAFWCADSTQLKKVHYLKIGGKWKKSKSGISQIKGTEGLMFEAIPEVPTRQDWIACEGEFDALTLAYCGYRARCDKDKKNPDSSSIIFTLFDRDEAGEAFTKNYENTFDLRPFVLAGVREGETGIDVNDALQELGKEEVERRLAEGISAYYAGLEKRKDAVATTSCIYEEEPFSESDKVFIIDKNIFDSSCDTQNFRYIARCLGILGKCNGRLVVEKDGAILSPEIEKLVMQTLFKTEKGLKRLKKDDRNEISELLKYTLKREKYIPILPQIPDYEDMKESEDFADRLIDTYSNYVDKRKIPSIHQYMRVMGYILSGDFWAKKDRRFFINIVSKEQGIGKTNLLMRSMLKNLKVCTTAVPQKEQTNQFSFSNYSKYDILCFDDITEETVKKMIPILTNIVSNSAFECEKKGIQSEQIYDYKCLVMVSGNKELILNEPTGLTRKKRLLIKFINTRKASKNMEVLSSSLIKEMEAHRGIERAFLMRCIEAYRTEPQIEDMLCSETEEERNTNIFSLFQAVYHYTPLTTARNGKYNFADVFSEALSDMDRISFYRMDSGKIDMQKLRADFANMVDILRISKELDVNFEPASLYNQKITVNFQDFLWSGKNKSKSEEKNCFISTGDWGKLQRWLESIDPEGEDGERVADVPAMVDSIIAPVDETYDLLTI